MESRRQRAAQISPPRGQAQRPPSPPRPPCAPLPLAHGWEGSGRSALGRRATPRPHPQPWLGPRCPLSCCHCWASPPPLSRVSCPLAARRPRLGSPYLPWADRLRPLPSGDSPLPPRPRGVLGGLHPDLASRPHLSAHPVRPRRLSVWSSSTPLPVHWVPRERPGEGGRGAPEKYSLPSTVSTSSEQTPLAGKGPQMRSN